MGVCRLVTREHSVSERTLSPNRGDSVANRRLPTSRPSLVVVPDVTSPSQYVTPRTSYTKVLVLSSLRRSNLPKDDVRDHGGSGVKAEVSPRFVLGRQRCRGLCHDDTGHRVGLPPKSKSSLLSCVPLSHVSQREEGRDEERREGRKECIVHVKYCPLFSV